MENNKVNLKSRLKRLNPDCTPDNGRKKLTGDELKKNIIDLHRNCTATAVIVSNDFYNKLDNQYIIDSKINDNDLFLVSNGNPVLIEKLRSFSKGSEISYLVIKDIDRVDKVNQERFIGIVKDRVFMSYEIPKNIIVVFTIENKENLKNISSELYHLCVVAF